MGVAQGWCRGKEQNHYVRNYITCPQYLLLGPELGPLVLIRLIFLPRRARRSFVEFAADEQFGDLRYFARGQGMFNAKYIFQQAGGPKEALPFDWESFQTSPADMRIVAFDAVSGDEVVWSRKNTPHIDDLMVRVRASSTTPALMPPVHLAMCTSTARWARTAESR